MSKNGIYVMFVYPAKGESRGETIKFHGNRLYLTVQEILKFFGILKLNFGEKVWIKRKNTVNVRPQSYGLASQLSWEDFEKCTVIIAPSHEEAMKALNPTTSSADYPKTLSWEEKYHRSLEEQKEIWKEKQEVAQEKPAKIPKTAALRKAALKMLVRKKRKARIGKAESKGEKQENNNTPSN